MNICKQIRANIQIAHFAKSKIWSQVLLKNRQISGNGHQNQTLQKPASGIVRQTLNMALVKILDQRACLAKKPS